MPLQCYITLQAFSRRSRGIYPERLTQHST
uniref:Uncharacterized protein n=1 Tax=Anguilla anguilla TaxID=7936 RepID=A0A0E9UUC0_ANGAN